MLIATDEEALICDLAETYHIFNYRKLPPKLVAILAKGLRDDSRIKLKLSGNKMSFNTLLSAMLVDEVRFFRYMFSDDAKNRNNVPVSVVETMFKEHDESNDTQAIYGIEEFDNKLEELRKEG